jgi:hypothetical protein
LLLSRCFVAVSSLFRRCFVAVPSLFRRCYLAVIAAVILLFSDGRLRAKYPCFRGLELHSSRCGVCQEQPSWHPAPDRALRAAGRDRYHRRR